MKPEGILQFGEFEIDALARTLRRNQEVVTLSRRAFEVLLYLAQNPGRVIPRDELLKNVWSDTFVDESSLAQSMSVLRRALDEKRGDNSYIVTLPGRGYQFVAPVTVVAPVIEVIAPQASTSAGNTSGAVFFQQQMIRTSVVTEEKSEAERLSLPMPRSRRRGMAALAAVLAIALGAYLYVNRPPKLTSKDTVVLGDFVNTTGDPVFDFTLRQGLSADLQQSPFFNLLSDQRIGQTLALMTQLKDARLTPELAREVCQRTASTAVLDGAIAQVGTRYLVTLKAVSCGNGELLAGTNAQAVDKSHVLDALDKVATAIRPKLGESLASAEKYDVPLQNVTTSSLEALQAYSLGNRAVNTEGDGVKAVPLYQRAIALDPNFAMAYVQLGVRYFNSGETARARENLQTAYELRERVSEREKFSIAAHHADIGEGDFEASGKTYELWAQIYPRDWVPLNGLDVSCDFLGRYEEGLAAAQGALRLDPGNATDLANVVDELINLNRLEEAKTAVQQANAVHPGLPVVHAQLYLIDFLQHNTAGMEQEAAWPMGKPGWEIGSLFAQSETAAYEGKFSDARGLMRRAIDSSERDDSKEGGAAFEAAAAVREALAGNPVLAKQQARAALAKAKNTEIEGMSAIALALADGPGESALLADQLDKGFPKGTVVQFNFLPSIRAAAALRTDPGKAIAALAVSAPYELGQSVGFFPFCLYPIYFRGEAYLAAKQGTAAAAEFQKILDHPGLVRNEPIGALAHLGLARAYALSGDTAKAKAKYEEFFTLWKDADPGVPILKKANAEYAKMK